MERRLRLVAFDMDGVLTNARNSWTALHDHFGTNNEHSLRQFIRDEIDDHEFIRRDVALWTGRRGRVRLAEVHEALAPMHASDDAMQITAFLKKRGIKIVIITGGVDFFAERIGREIGADRFYSNGLEVDGDGYLTGKGIVGVPLKSKDRILRRVRDELCIDRDECVSIGDSFIDVPMFNESRFGIAVRPLDEQVRNAARYCVRDLIEAMEILKPLI
jgi:phosphoserine phosphatase